MKKFFILGVALLSVVALMAAQQSHSTSLDKLPAKSRDFVHRYFAGDKISSIDHTKHNTAENYVVNFANGDKVAFEAHSGDCVSIHLAEGAIPSTLLPKGVHDYLNAHHPGVQVTSLDRIKGGSCVGLSNGEKVCLNKEGKQICGGK